LVASLPARPGCWHARDRRASALPRPSRSYASFGPGLMCQGQRSDRSAAFPQGGGPEWLAGPG
jgi:hypothetical protein